MIVESLPPFIVGLALGSFFNVLIYRLPRGKSIVWPGSRCPSCERPIRAWENIPLFSYAALRGACAGCGRRISIQYPLIELLTGLLAVTAWFALLDEPISQARHWSAIISPAFQALALLILIPVAVIDLYHYIIPDSISLGGLAAACLVSFVPGGLSPQQAALGICAGGGSLLAVGLIGEWVLKKKDAMGGGDVKLMAFTGAAFGWQTALLGIVFGSLCGSVVGIGLIIAGKLGKERRIPFGPFLAIGIWTAALSGQRILDAYMRLIERLLFS